MNQYDPKIYGRMSVGRRSGDKKVRNGGRSAPPLVFESSWEVCSQAGGIYTVLRSKCPASVKRWGDGYWLVGPYREAAAKIEFEPQPAPGPVGEAVKELSASGVSIHTGRWLVTGRPRVILIDIDSVRGNINNWKYFLWKDHGIGTPAHDPETDDIVAFSFVTADLLMEVEQRIGKRPMLFQAHEWQGGGALPLLDTRGAKFSTVFTTHATLVGRSLCAANRNLYDDIATYNAERIADEHGIGHRFRIERAAAKAADVFTTVSEITALEAEHFLDRPADSILPNGLNVERHAAPHEFQNLHQQNKERIHEFVMGHFFPSYRFDLDKTLYLFTAGRYEYRNKGIDVYIDALHELNRRLKAENSAVTVIAFIVTRAPYRGYNVESLNRQAMFHELRRTCAQIKEDMGRQLFGSVADGRLPTTEDLLDEYARVRLKRMIHAWSKTPPPPIVTHDLVDDLNDPTLMALRRNKLFNLPDDPVKVVFHPEFVSPTSPLLGIEYDDFVRGCNVGVFPSYYEPWGYTPMECIIRGIPAITSDLSGFGAYMEKHFPEHESHGCFVANRRHVTYEQTVYQVANWLHQLSRLSLRERIHLRNRVEAYAEHFDWASMMRYYRNAWRKAFKLRYPDREIVPAETADAVVV